MIVVAVAIRIRPKRDVVDMRPYGAFGLERVKPREGGYQDQDSGDGRPHQHDPIHLRFLSNVGGQTAFIILMGYQH